MKYIDLHCDTLMFIPNGEETLLSNTTASVDFRRLKKGNCLAQFFAIFLLSEDYLKEYGKDYMGDDDYILSRVNNLKKAVEENKDLIQMAYNYHDIIRNDKKGKMSTILTIEDGRSINNDLAKIKEYYDLGIRLITLTWNFENCLGYPNSDDPKIMNKGLKDFGKEAVEYMNELGIIIDVSHLSDGGFYDVAEISRLPFIASHSNARALSPHRRNLTDDMIRIIGERGGVIGLNFAPGFLNEDTTSRDSTIELMVKHLKHIKDKGGEEVLALGTDFDGIGGNLQIPSADKLPLLFEALRREGWSEDLIEKFAYKNALRVIRDVMK